MLRVLSQHRSIIAPIVWSAIIVAAGTIEEKVLDLSPSDTIIKTYLRDIQHLEEQQITHELGIKGPRSKIF
jgi:hypothetical protein